MGRPSTARNSNNTGLFGLGPGRAGRPECTPIHAVEKKQVAQQEAERSKFLVAKAEQERASSLRPRRWLGQG
jgi:hypothetical protein